jgi:hypothetical protein
MAALKQGWFEKSKRGHEKGAEELVFRAFPYLRTET